MNEKTKLKIWFLETRPKFLLLSVVLVLVGTAVSRYEGNFDGLKFFLTMIALLLAHTSVNVLNDYFDYQSGIDTETTPTAFSGGSGILTQGLLSPKSVHLFGIGCLVAAFPIGIYLTYASGWKLLPLIFLGGGIIYSYTPYLTKWLVGEFVAGLGLGSLPVLGTYFIQTGSYSIEAIVASFAPGFLTANLLFLNEFPDVEADKKGGRYNLVIALGKRKASRLYAGLTITAYLCILGGVAMKLMPPLCLVALASIPFASKSIRIACKHYDNTPRLIPALQSNVITILGTDALLALGYFIS